MICGIYSIRSIVSGKCYVGSSKNVRARWKHHRNELRSGKHSNWKLRAAFNKYGLDGLVFEVLEECSQSELRAREISWIEQLNSYKNGYNCSDKGAGATEATIPAIREANFRRKGVSCGKGRVFTDEHKRNIATSVSRAYAEGRGPSVELIREGLRKRREREAQT